MLEDFLALRLVEIIHQSLERAVNRLYPQAEITGARLSHPEIEAHGDYASNVALILARQLDLKQMAVAQHLAEILKQDSDLSAIASVEAVAPGFINFHLQEKLLTEELLRIIASGDSYGQSQRQAGKNVLLEFGQPNTHKVPHIGHLFSYCFGESCSRLWQAVGATVWRVNYQGDVGLHVAKCLWAYQQTPTPELKTLEEKVHYLQQCYQQGSAGYEDSPEAKLAIDALNGQIYKQSGSVKMLWQETRQWSLDYYRQFEQRLGISYVRHYLESEVAQTGIDLVKKNIGTVFAESEGAVIFRGENYGLHTRVFINSQGYPTYEAKDIGLISVKQSEYPFDLSLVMTGNEQNDYWQVLRTVTEILFPSLAGKIKHLGYGMINLTSGKMSSRSGKIITAFSLVAMVKDQVVEFIKQNRKYDDGETASISEAVALAAIRYSFLKKAATKDLTFDVKTSIAFEGNSGPYLQYAYARCQSVLAKAVTGIPTNLATVSEFQPEELGLLRWLYRFPEVVVVSAEEFSPHYICTYLYELAQRYSLFYDRHKILVEDKNVSAFRLQLTASTAQVLKTGLNLLGIDVLDKI